MRKFIAWLLLLATLLALFSGCSDGENSTITMGQWLSMIAQEFGMDSYSREEPYFSNIKSDHDYFTVVQACADWGVVDTTQALDVDDAVTWKDALVTLVNAGAFVDEDATEDEKVTYAIEHFDSSIREYWLSRTIQGTAATTLLATAQNLWADKTYENDVAEVEYADDVVDLSQGENAVTDYTVDEDGVIAIPVSENVSVEAGQIYCLPGNGEIAESTAFRAEEVTTDGAYIYITNAEEDVELEDFVENLDVETTVNPSMDEIIVYDGNGNVISNGAEIVSQYMQGTGTAAITTLGHNGGDATVTTLAGGKVTHTFEIDGVKVSFEYVLNGKFDFKASFTSENLLSEKYQKAHPGQALNFIGSAEISDLSVTADAKVEWFKLKSASLRMDYTTKTEVGISYSGKSEKLLAPEDQNVTAKTWKSTFVKNWTNSVWKDKNADDVKGAKTIKIASVTLKNSGVYRVCLDINFVITAKGSVSIVITENGSKGIEYKNGSVRTIKTSKKDVDVSVKGSLEGYLSAGPTLYVTGLKKPVAGVSIKVGLGANVAVNFHVADAQGHLIQEVSLADAQGEAAEMFIDAELQIPTEVILETAESLGVTYDVDAGASVTGHLDVCFDGTIYFILRIGVNDYCYISDMVKSSLDWEIFGSKNAKLIHIHADNGEWQFGWIGKDTVACKLEYTAFDAEETDETVESTDASATGDDEIPVFGNIALDAVWLSVNAGGTATLQVTGIPSGYTGADLQWTSEKTEIATVDNNGVITGVSEGSTVITVSTKDGKFHAYCAVMVTSAGSNVAAPISEGGTYV